MFFAADCLLVGSSAPVNLLGVYELSVVVGLFVWILVKTGITRTTDIASVDIFFNQKAPFIRVDCPRYCSI
jgi:hypothetical protein